MTSLPSLDEINDARERLLALAIVNEKRLGDNKRGNPVSMRTVTDLHIVLGEVTRLHIALGQVARAAAKERSEK